MGVPCQENTMHTKAFSRIVETHHARAVRRGLTAFGLAAVAAASLGCNNAGEGALSGAGLGAAGGAIIGSLYGSAGTGAAIGAVAGGLTGAVVGDQNNRRDRNGVPRDW